MITRKEAIERIEHHKSNAKFVVKYSHNEHDVETEWKDIEAFDMAIEALTTQDKTQGDLISRADALNEIQEFGRDVGCLTSEQIADVQSRLRKIPSAEETGAMDDAIVKYVKNGWMKLPPTNMPTDGDLTNRVDAIVECLRYLYKVSKGDDTE